MLLFFTVFIKRPYYALAFIPMFFLYLVGYFQGNGFPALATFIISCLFWCFFSLANYIGDKSINTKILGVDLKIYVPMSYNFLCIQGAILAISWFPILADKMSFQSTFTFMTFVFLVNFAFFFIGAWLLLASLAIKVSKTNAKLDKPTASRLIDDMKSFLSQPAQT